MKRPRGFVVRGRTWQSNWPSNWATNRDCICANAEEHVLEPDGSCYACGGRVVKRAPFHAEDWRRE